MLVLASGRSNCFGGGAATDGAPSSLVSPRVRVWNNTNPLGANGTAFVPPVLGQPPFRTTSVANNAPLWFCDRAARFLKEDIQLVMPLKGGTPIDDWLPGGLVHAEMRDVYSATGCPPADLAIWIHGEWEDPSDYGAQCSAVFQGWRDDGLLRSSAPILVSGAPPALFPAIYVVQEDLESANIHFVQTSGLDRVPNEEHWTGSALVRLGWERLWGVYERLYCN